MTDESRRLFGPPTEPVDYLPDAIQWVFNNPDMRERFGKHVNVRFMQQALADLQFASSKQPGNPHEVLLAWRMLNDVLGPFLMHWFFESAEWEKWVKKPTFTRSTSSRLCVWEQADKTVMVYLQYSQDRPAGFDFRVE